MPALEPFEVVCISGDYTPYQLQPHRVVQWSMEAFARWTRRHVGSWQQMLLEHRTGIVVAQVEIDYAEPHRFVDSPALDVDTHVYCEPSGRVAYGHYVFRAGSKHVCTLGCTLMPVAVAEDSSMAATQGRLRGTLLHAFAADEEDLPLLAARRGRPRLRARVSGLLETHPLLGQCSYTFTLHRHRCEVADQWLVTQIPALISEGRETLALRPGAHQSPVVAGVSGRIQRLEYELYRPFFAFESGRLASTALAQPDRCVFVHQLNSPATGLLHGYALEVMEHVSSAALAS